jgi:hypothetical protein
MADASATRPATAEPARCCYSCGLELDAEEFAADRSKGSGRKSICKVCDREKARAYYERKVDLHAR